MLPLRVRHPEGVSTIQIDETLSTISDLLAAISSATGLPSSSLEIKAGYPPKPLLWKSPAAAFSTLGLGKNEQLIVATSSSSSSGPSLTSNPTPATAPKPLALPAKREVLAPLPSSTASASSKAAGSVKASGKGAAVELGDSYLILYIVPDDNSCLFSAVASVFAGGIGAAQSLRKVVSSAIRADPETYSEVFLERAPEDYIRRIEDPKTWGGAIELSIFSKHYSTEIASVEVASGRIDRFGQGEGYSSRCILVYSGIHYDSCFLSLTPTIDDPAFCETVFSVDNEGILEATMRLAARLKQEHYYTDTATFDLRCGVCGQGLKGEKEATEHAKATSHTDFREY